ncbi:putative receptor-like protein kinase At3g47110 [Humulus lupulus]|uniref:putative receptor-like protein kinase At3g47110 n=1 Tax=Humulus lupulus TaxID=3486 RepID=UPI002B414011|nr:putative receptor-like protein kinase At3g47110 [Humulus lupulus]
MKVPKTITYNSLVDQLYTLIEADKSRIDLDLNVIYHFGKYGQGIEVSVKGDVYSFGVILLEMISRKRPTSSLFQDGLDLRKWILSCCPNNISDIIDITLKKQATIEGLVCSVERLEECCSSLLHVALSCTEDNPHQ